MIVRIQQLEGERRGCEVAALDAFAGEMLCLGGEKAEERGNEGDDKRVPRGPCVSISDRGSRGAGKCELCYGLARLAGGVRKRG